MNLGQLSARVGNLTSSLSTAADGDFVNDAVQDIAQRRRWSWLTSSASIALSGGQRTYSLLGTTPTVTDFGSPISVTLVKTANLGGFELGRMDPQTFERFTAHCHVNSVPMFWTLQGGTAASTSATVLSGGQQVIALAPTPTGASGEGVSITIRYWRSLASIRMSAASDVPILPTDLHQMIVSRACAMAMEANVMFDLAAGFQASFERQLAAAMDTDQQMYGGDANTLILKPVPMEAPQVPVTQASYNPASRPLPQAV